jgi:hypothetical protein
LHVHDQGQLLHLAAISETATLAEAQPESHSEYIEARAMTSGRPDVASTGSEDNVGPSAWATEQTPLIAPSGATDANGLENGHGDGNGNGFGASNETNGRPGSSAADADPDGTAKVPVGRLRAVAIAVSTWLLIFLQSTYRRRQSNTHPLLKAHKSSSSS